MFHHRPHPFEISNSVVIGHCGREDIQHVYGTCTHHGKDLGAFDKCLVPISQTVEWILLVKSFFQVLNIDGDHQDSEETAQPNSASAILSITQKNTYGLDPLTRHSKTHQNKNTPEIDLL